MSTQTTTKLAGALTALGAAIDRINDTELTCASLAVAAALLEKERITTKRMGDLVELEGKLRKLEDNATAKIDELQRRLDIKTIRVVELEKELGDKRAFIDDFEERITQLENDRLNPFSAGLRMSRT